MSIRVLWDLQEVDLALDHIAQELADIESHLHTPAILQELAHQIATLEAELHHITVRQADLELEIAGLSEHIEDLEKRLYGGYISNPREIEAAQQKAAEMRRRRSHLEDELLDLMEMQERLDANHRDLTARLQEEEARWDVVQSGLLEKQAHLRAEHDHLVKRRAKLIARIPPDIVTVYERLRRVKGGMAVSRLKNRVCEACGVEVPRSVERQVKYEEGIVYCPTCGRILASIV